MAVKYLQILSTRRTKIGLFRAGTIRRVDVTDNRVAKIVDNLTDKGTKKAPKSPAAVSLSKKDAERAREEVESLIPEAEPVSAIDDVLRDKARVEDELAETRRALTATRKDLKAESENVVQLRTALDEARLVNEQLTGDLRDALAQSATPRKDAQA